MTKRTKTLQALVNKANQYIAASQDSEVEGRQMLETFVSAMLMEANSYKGYNYSYWLNGGYAKWLEASSPEDETKDQYLYGPTMDKTRITYY